MTAPDKASSKYDLPTIRNQLIKNFTDEDLRAFCQDTPDFEPVYHRLAQNTGKDEIVSLLLDHAERHLLLETLLDRVKAHQSSRHNIPNEQLIAHRKALTEISEYYQWADESSEESFIRQQNKILPISASPYEDDVGLPPEDLLQTIQTHERLLIDIIGNKV